MLYIIRVQHDFHDHLKLLEDDKKNMWKICLEYSLSEEVYQVNLWNDLWFCFVLCELGIWMKI